MTLPDEQFAILLKEDGIWLAGKRATVMGINLANPDTLVAERLAKRLALIRQRPDFMEMTAPAIAEALLRHEV
jgi:hypothetical protein